VQGNSISVERVINAPASDIFAMIADAGRHSSFDGSGTVDHAVSDVAGRPAPGEKSQRLELGSKFGMSMRGRPETLFLPYRTTNTVVEFEADRRIAWQTRTGPLGLIGGRIWRYELTPVDGGTLVRMEQSGFGSVTDLSYTRIGGRWPRWLERLEQGMEAIAIEIERVAEGQRFVTRLLSEGHAGESVAINRSMERSSTS